jgi:hypothetical protein
MYRSAVNSKSGDKMTSGGTIPAINNLTGSISKRCSVSSPAAMTRTHGFGGDKLRVSSTALQVAPAGERSWMVDQRT